MKIKLYLFLSTLFVVSCGDEDNFCEPNPTLSTYDVSDITDISAKFSGEIIAPTCDVAVATQGFVYSNTTLPKLDDSVLEVKGDTITFILNNLEQNTEYFVRSFFKNNIGQFYGDEVSFKTTVGDALSNLSSVVDIKAHSASVSGEINTDGGGEVTLKGICWSTATSPTIEDSKTEDGSGIGNFTSNMMELKENTKYYVRTYAVNEVGVSYGEEVSFSTRDGVVLLTSSLVTDITANTATVKSSITNDGGSEVTLKGICWSTATSPTIEDSKTVDGSGIGNFTGNMMELKENTKYYVRTYAVNEVGVSYGEEVSFSTRDGVVLLTSSLVTDITANTATVKSSITNDGGSEVTLKGICWSTATSPTIEDSKTEDGSGTGNFTGNMTELKENTKYYVRTYAVNEAGVSYGEEVSFETVKPLPTVYLIGDSTCASYDVSKYPLTGWGATVSKSFDNKQIKFDNRAKPGRSSKSFYHETGAWNVVVDDVNIGDFVIIQFGHNDTQRSDTNRYTEPFTTFQEYLRKYIQEIRKKDAYPILATPVSKNSWRDGFIINTSLGDYTTAIRELALTDNIPLLDANLITKNLFEARGKSYTNDKIFMNLIAGEYTNYPEGSSDDTHFQENGAYLVSEAIAVSLNQLSEIFNFLLVFNSSYKVESH